MKALAKRQASTTRFGSVVILTHSCVAAMTRRVYEHVFADWRVLVGGGLANGGRDDRLEVRCEPALPWCKTHTKAFGDWLCTGPH